VGIATVTMVESSMIMKKHAQSAHIAVQGLRMGCSVSVHLADLSEQAEGGEDVGMRHSDRAVQMPTSASGNRLCRHGTPGGCSRWCSYKLFARVIVLTVLLLTVICGLVWLSGGEGQHRVRDVLYGLAFYLAIVIPGIAFMNSRERE
jgi:hypothetical protein